MPSVTLYANKSAYLSYEYPNANSYGSATVTASATADSVLIGFAAPPENMKYKHISNVMLYVYADGRDKRSTWYLQSVSVACLTSGFDEKTATYNNRPSSNYADSALAPEYNTNGKEWLSCELDLGLKATSAARYGVKISSFESIDTAYSSNKPYLTVDYVDENASIYLINLAPQSGYVPKNAASVFSWGVQPKYYSIEEVKPTATTFRWRAGSSGTVHTIACGTAKSVTVPAGTFTADEIQWSLSAVLNTGETVESAWYTLSTVEALSTAVPVSPSGIVIDGSAVNRFSWQHIISTGTAQTKADLQWSSNGSNWSALATVNGANAFYDVPADTFVAGTKFWRVRTYNTDNAAGEWSTATEFIAINAPSTPSIQVTSTAPRPRIAWQTSEQQAYQLELSNGYKTGTVYGVEKTWRAASYLPDGNYTVRVRVQNQYGMWSEWADAALPVTNVAGEAITLSAGAAHEAVLVWQTSGSYDFYLVERDGVPIAKTTEKTYTDRTSIGTVQYQIRGCYTGSDNYGLSAAVSVEVLPAHNMVCDLETGVWLDLHLSQTQTRSNSRTHSAQITAVHLLGLRYPVAEVAEFRDLSIAVSCAFPRTQRAAALALEALVGRMVCLKTPEGGMVSGYLIELTSETDEFMFRYSFAVQQLYRQEVIDIDA